MGPRSSKSPVWVSPMPWDSSVVAADSGSGIGAVFDPSRLVSFINADLTVSLHRLPAGEWVGLDAVTALEPHGIGLTRTLLHDVEGPVGEGLQGLVTSRPAGR